MVSGHVEFVAAFAPPRLWVVLGGHRSAGRHSHVHRVARGAVAALARTPWRVRPRSADELPPPRGHRHLQPAGFQVSTNNPGKVKLRACFARPRGPAEAQSVTPVGELAAQVSRGPGRPHLHGARQTVSSGVLPAHPHCAHTPHTTPAPPPASSFATTSLLTRLTCATRSTRI